MSGSTACFAKIRSSFTACELPSWRPLLILKSNDLAAVDVAVCLAGLQRPATVDLVQQEAMGCDPTDRFEKVPPHLAGETIEVHFDPRDLSQVEIYLQGQSQGWARAVDGVNLRARGRG